MFADNFRLSAIHSQLNVTGWLSCARFKLADSVPARPINQLRSCAASPFCRYWAYGLRIRGISPRYFHIQFMENFSSKHESA